MSIQTTLLATMLYPRLVTHTTNGTRRMVPRELARCGDAAIFGMLPRSFAMPRPATSAATAPVLDRPGCTERLTVRAYGVRVGVQSDDPALLARLRRRLPPASRRIENGEVDVLYTVTSRDCPNELSQATPLFVGHSGATRFVETTDEAAACAAFESAVRFDVAVMTERWVFVHAGVVGWNGRAVVIPAPSMNGKSRLVNALVKAGATYYSDEFAVIDRHGRVHPFPIAVSLRTEHGGAERVRLARPARETPPLPIGLVVSTRYEERAEWQPRRATSAEALLALLSNTVRIRLAPRATLKVLARAVASAEMIESPRGEADRVAPKLLEETR